MDKIKLLEQRIEELETNYIKLKRAYDDILLELENSSTVKKIQKKQGLFASELKITAKEISTKVTEKDIDNKLVNYSTITQTSNSIKTAVGDVKNDLTSTITQTAESLETKIAEILDISVAEPVPVNWNSPNHDDFDSATNDDFDDLDKNKIYYTWEYGKKYDEDEMLTWDKSVKHPITYFRYNSDFAKWEKVLDGTVYSTFYQTPNGFILKGNVAIHGNVFKQVDYNDNTFLIDNGELSLSPISGSKKYVLGFSTYQDSGNNTMYCPYMRFGSGTSDIGTTVNGMTVYPGTGVIFKNDGAFILEFIGSDGFTNSIMFCDEGAVTDDESNPLHQSHVNITGRVFINGVSVGNLQNSTSIAVFG